MRNPSRIMQPTTAARRLGRPPKPRSAPRRAALLTRLLPVAVLAALAAPTLSADRVTEGKFYSCLSTQWLDEFTAFAVSDDIDQVQAYLKGNKCLLLKPNLPVTIAEGSSVLGPRTEFLIQGIRFYAPSEEIVAR